MATSNNKRIEETATTALKAVLLRCPILESFIDSNDKTPSWDGTVFVYKNGSFKKDDMLGRAPIQIKGTEAVIVSDTASYSCQLSDIRNYYRDGGCIFFLISVDTSNGAANIYYASLQVFDLKKFLDSAGRQKTKTIKLDKFPQDDSNEMASIFMSFVENSRKQTSFIGKEIVSLEQLEKNGVGIESISFNTSGVGLNIYNIGTFISTHDFYIYARPKGLDIDIPVEKVSNAIVSNTFSGKVLVKETEYYSSYNVIYEKGDAILRVGKGISISLDHPNSKITVNFKPTGTLSDFILDASCFIDMIESQEITLDGGRILINGMNSVDLSKYKDSLQYYKDVKRMLDFLGVTEELQCGNLSDKDENNIRNFVNAVLYNKRIGFPEVKDSVIHGPIKIANLSIWIWATRQEDGYYQLENFFDPHSIVLFDGDDTTQSNPIPASHYLLLNKEAFVHTSNMDYEVIKSDLCSMKFHPLLIESVTFMMLNVLRGYDEQKEKDERLLNLAEIICNWLSMDKETAVSPIQRLNQLQIEKRRRTLTTQEVIELGRFTGMEYPANIRCGAYLLLEDSSEAQKCYDEMSQETQREFITFPICHFGKLIQREIHQLIK
ncbi:MAG: hypothetical protein K6F23_03150 [Solobacterium sp.]|nr:hypothetical protein [Solobacterium sp.]